MRKVIYWLTSLYLIIVLFLFFFGVVGNWIIQSQVDHVKVFASLMALIGLSLIMFTMHVVHTLLKPLMKKSDSSSDTKVGNVGVFILGVAFVTGALAYSLVHNVLALIRYIWNCGYHY